MYNIALRKSIVALMSLLLTIGLVLAVPLPASAGANWIRVSSGTTNSLNGVCYGNSKCVAVGDGGIILTSSNLSSWSKPASCTANDLLGVSTNGSGLFVAVGTNGTIVYSSNSGANWSNAAVSASNTTGCITYGGGTFMAFFGADCYISTNGSSWTKKATVSSNVNGVAYGDSKFWIVGNSIASYSADSGASWSNWNWCYCSSSALNTLVYNNATYFISFGNSGMAYETFNSGDTYDKRTGFTSYIFKGSGYGFIDGAIFFVGVGANGATGAIVTTETTASWNDKTVEYMPAGTPALNAVCYGTTMFVAVGESGAILVSSGVSSPPVFTSGTTSSCSENSTNTGYTAAATPSNGTSVTYSLGGGVDDSLFNLNSSTGVLTFKTAPNYESPADSGANNVYNVIIRATDSMADADQNVAVTVTNVNESPSITSGTSVSLPENQTAAYTATADDPDSGGTITWSITGGSDAALFNINGNSGAVTFKTAPDFETPGDSDHNNVYNITVKVTDNGGLFDTEDVAITVTDAADQPAVATGAASNISAAGAALSGTVNDNGGDTTVYFQYGTNTGYGTEAQATTPAGGVVSGGSGNTSVGLSLTTLSPGTTYHYRVKAVNTAGTVYGDDSTFTTALPAPTADPGNGNTVDSGSNVTLSNTTAGATIYYTTDNTDPTNSGGTRQAGTTVAITGGPGATVTVKAYATLAGYNDSAVATFTYTIKAYNLPTLAATGGSPTYYQGESGVDLFSSVTAAVNDAGQTFSGAVLTASNVADTTEYLAISGTDVALTNGSSGAIAGIGGYSVSVSSGTATVTLSGLSLNNSDMQTLIDGISYKNSAAPITTGSRVVTLKTITDSGINNSSATVNITATVTVTTPVDIICFDTMAGVDAGYVGSATYANAAAVIAVLPASVKANGNTVTVAVTAWADTDGYNPAQVGSYTFTATLGALPVGVTNTGNHTATIEVVVKANTEITSFDAIPSVDAGFAGTATYVNAAAVIAALPANVTANGNVVTIPATTWVNTDAYDPTRSGSYTFTATLGAMPVGWANTGNYTATVEVVVKANTEITSFDAIPNVDAGFAGTATYANAATVKTVLPTTVTANGNSATVPVASWTDTDTYNPAQVGSYTFTATLGAMPVGYANAGSYTATVEVVVKANTEITSFDAIPNVDAGFAGTATYVNAAAVIAALPANVTANGNAVTVPATAWVNTDAYDPTRSGSYTFTATLGAMPVGWANTGNYTATVEVVVKANTEITGFDAIPDVDAGYMGNPIYADAAAVIAILPAIVTANGNTVSVPVAAWVNTDSYTPVQAGNYTFTATLGAMPIGCANTGGYTATIEVVVNASTLNIGAQNGEITAGTSGSATFTAAAANIADNTLVLINWCNASGNPAAAPAGFSAAGTNVAANASAITITANASAVAGTYYFTATCGAAVSNVVTVTVLNAVTAGSGDTVNITAPTTITVPPGVTGVEIKIPDPAQPLPEVDIISSTSLGTVEIEIPAGTTVNGSGVWDGTISLPTVLANPSAVVTGAQSVNAVVEIGFGNETITFSNAVRLLIPGMAGKSAGYIKNGIFTPITRTLSADNQATADIEIPANGDAKINAGADLAIWTKHFTEFVAYTPSPGGVSSGGGGEATTLYTPLVQTGAAASVTRDTAILNGNITSNGGYDITGYGFLCGTTIGSLSNQVEAGSSNQTGAFSASLNSLTSATTYYFQAYAINSKGISYGSVLSFTTQSPGSSAPQAFIDIPTSFWGYTPITSLSGQGIVAGYPDNTFRPDAAISRAEFAAMLAKALGLNSSGSSGNFSDVPPGTWYYVPVNNAAERGLVSGTGDNRFSPEALITREQMAVMVSKALGNKAPVIVGSDLNAFIDRSSVSSWAVTGMEEAVKAGIIHGMTSDTLDPQANATRAQAAVMIYQLLNIRSK
ncbi:MAG: S-layer homology domain-containing protein [Syntrophomonas sp.]